MGVCCVQVSSCALAHPSCGICYEVQDSSGTPNRSTPLAATATKVRREEVRRFQQAQTQRKNQHRDELPHSNAGLSAGPKVRVIQGVTPSTAVIRNQSTAKQR